MHAEGGHNEQRPWHRAASTLAAVFPLGAWRTREPARDGVCVCACVFVCVRVNLWLVVAGDLPCAVGEHTQGPPGQGLARVLRARPRKGKRLCCHV